MDRNYNNTKNNPNQTDNIYQYKHMLGNDYKLLKIEKGPCTMHAGPSAI